MGRATSHFTCMQDSQSAHFHAVLVLHKAPAIASQGGCPVAQPLKMTRVAAVQAGKPVAGLLVLHSQANNWFPELLKITLRIMLNHAHQHLWQPCGWLVCPAQPKIAVKLFTRCCPHNNNQRHADQHFPMAGLQSTISQADVHTSQWKPYADQHCHSRT